MKTKLTLTTNDIALPLHFIWEFEKTHWMIVIHVLIFAFSVGYVYEATRKKIQEVQSEDLKPKNRWRRKEDMLATRAYADQRQKAPRNRKKKPSKAMANIYGLE